jgi:hypothetical protein
MGGAAIVSVSLALFLVVALLYIHIGNGGVDGILVSYAQGF